MQELPAFLEKGPALGPHHRQHRAPYGGGACLVQRPGGEGRRLGPAEELGVTDRQVKGVRPGGREQLPPAGTSEAGERRARGHVAGGALSS